MKTSKPIHNHKELKSKKCKKKHQQLFFADVYNSS